MLQHCKTQQECRPGCRKSTCEHSRDNAHNPVMPARPPPTPPLPCQARPAIEYTSSQGCVQQVRVYSIPDCPDGEESILGRPLATQRLASKLSSLAWSPDIRVSQQLADA